jgi:hypothetical protein
MQRALAMIGGTEALRVGSVYRLATTRGQAYGRERAAVYEALVVHLDERLVAPASTG